MKDGETLREQNVTNNSKIMVIGSTFNDVMAINERGAKVKTDASATLESSSKELLCKQKASTKQMQNQIFWLLSLATEHDDIISRVRSRVLRVFWFHVFVLNVIITVIFLMPVCFARGVPSNRLCISDIAQVFSVLG